MRLLLTLLALLLPTAALAQPTALPDPGQMEIRPGQPYIRYQQLLGSQGLPEWHKRAMSLEADFTPRFAELDTYMKAAEDAYQAAQKAEPPQKAALTEKSNAASIEWNARQQELYRIFGARQDELLNPLVPALLAGLSAFATEKGYAPQPLPILMPQHEQVAAPLQMRDVTAEFVAWEKARNP